MEKKKAMKWVKALRSGEYKQGNSQLLDSVRGNYCCLGVLCKISGLKEEEFEGRKDLEGMMERCGIKSYIGVPDNKDITIKIGTSPLKFRSLAEANDSGTSFDKIATWIEKNYKLL